MVVPLNQLKITKEARIDAITRDGKQDQETLSVQCSGS
jgi:hypothetical protein